MSVPGHFSLAKYTNEGELVKGQRLRLRQVVGTRHIVRTVSLY